MNGSVVFDRNRAVFGGGVAMAGRSLVSGISVISITKIIRTCTYRNDLIEVPQH